MGSSATSSAAEPRQTTGIAQYPAPSPDHQEWAEKPHNGFSQTIKVLISNNYLPLITTAFDLYTKNHISLLHRQELTSREKYQTRPLSETFPSKSLSATRFLHATTRPSFGSLLDKVLSQKEKVSQIPLPALALVVLFRCNSTNLPQPSSAGDTSCTN